MRIVLLVALGATACMAAPSPSAAPSTPSSERSQPTEPSVASARDVSGVSVPFVIVGPTRGHATRPTVVVATVQQEVDALLTNARVATSVPDLPALPPGGAYLAAFAGPKGSATVRMEIISVRSTASTLVVWARQSGPGDTLLPLVSYPVTVARIAVSEIMRGRVIELRDVDSGVTLARVTYCGATIQRSPLDPDDGAARECVWAAYSAGTTAQFLRRSLTTEGGPIVTTLRAVPGGLSEVSRDDRLDGFASAPGVHSWACDQIARSSLVNGAGRTVTWFSLSRCSGDGTEVEVP